LEGVHHQVDRGADFRPHLGDGGYHRGIFRVDQVEDLLVGHGVHVRRLGIAQFGEQMASVLHEETPGWAETMHAPRRREVRIIGKRDWIETSRRGIG
jgi:hypothetical protein